MQSPQSSSVAPPPPVPNAPTCSLKYYGGKVIQNVVVYAVNWGPNVNATVKNNIGGFYSSVTASAYFDWLSEYNTVGATVQGGGTGSNQGIARGIFGGSYTITPSVTSTTITDVQIQAELKAQLTAGNLPAPNLAADGSVNAIYMFDFPPGLTIKQGTSTSCVVFCAYHGTVTYNGMSVPYGIHPDMITPGSGCIGGCGSNATAFNNVTSVHSHELVEAVTDMEIGLATVVGPPIAWYSTTSGCGEIGDICNAQQGTIGSYTVQKEWSNQAGACIVSKATLPPICTGAGVPSGCRVCTAADDGIGCTGATPHCETDKSNVKYGTCVACAKDSHCSGGKPICGKSATAAQDDVCRACVDGDCSGAKPACETAGTFSGQCVQCTTGKTSACMGTTAQCDTGTDTCVQCLVDGNCMATDQCHSATCSGAHTCMQNALTGTACDDNDACTMGDTCQAGTCTPTTTKTCTAIDQCHGAGTCVPATGMCTTPTLGDGTACSDGNACTMSDTCMGGACMSGTAVTCPAGDECNDAATCSMATGCSAVTPKPDGTACGSGGHCKGGTCMTALPPDMTMTPADMAMGSGGGGGGGGGDTTDDMATGTGGGGGSGGSGGGSGGCGSCNVAADAPVPWPPMILVGLALAIVRLRRRYG
jgi:hypothetical protein